MLFSLENRSNLVLEASEASHVQIICTSPLWVSRTLAKIVFFWPSHRMVHFFIVNLTQKHRLLYLNR